MSVEYIPQKRYCKSCGKDITYAHGHGTRNTWKRGDSKFCDDHCRNAWHNTRRKLKNQYEEVTMLIESIWHLPVDRDELKTALEKIAAHANRRLSQV